VFEKAVIGRSWPILEGISRDLAGADARSSWRFLGADGEPAELTHSRLCADDLFTLRRTALGRPKSPQLL
jgi:hypothetical protein